MIYLKFLKYTPTFSVVPKLLEKDIKELSPTDLKELYHFREEQDFAKVLERYLKKEGTAQDVLTVYDFIKAHPLEEYMNSKLTVQNVQESRKFVSQMLDDHSDRELWQMIKSYEQNPDLYEKLTIVEAYSFYQVEKILRRKDQSALEREIAAQVQENHAMYQRGLYLAKYLKR